MTRCTFRIWLGITLAFAALITTLPAYSQQITGQINGRVLDPTGAVVVGVTVTVVNADTNEVVRKVKSNKSGEYVASSLQVGNYKVTTDAPGFRKAEVSDITLNVGDELSRDLHLVAGSSSEITVTASNQQQPDVETNQNSTLIDNTEIKELALSTRNFEQLLILQPGVSYGGPDNVNAGQIDVTGQRSNHGLSINGLQPTQVEFTIDGADMLNHTSNAQVTIFPSPDSIQQIQTVRNNFGAQYGGGGNAQVILATKAGGSSYHGDAYFFFGNQALDATPYFDILGAIPKPVDRYNDFGYTIGGPVFIPKLYPKSRLKTFFFFSQELKRLAQGAQTRVGNFPFLPNTYGYFVDAVPGSKPVTNSPFPGFGNHICVTTNQQPPNGVVLPPCAVGETNADPVALEYLDDVFRPSVERVPAENLQGGSNTIILQNTSGTHETQELVRLDHQINDRLSVFFRYVYDPITQTLPNAIYSGAGDPGVSSTTATTTGTDCLGHVTWTARPNTVIELGLSYLPYRISATPTGFALAANSPDVHVNTPFPNTTGRIPGITMVDNAFSATGPFNDVASTLQVYENTTQSRGHHTIYFGVNFEHLADSASPGTQNSGNFSFNTTATGVTQFDASFAAFLLGKPTSFVQSSVDPHAQPQENLYEAYIQDTYRATATLTLNAGVRYSIFGAPGDFSPNTTGQFPNGKLGAFQPAAYNPALAPTLGVDGTRCVVNTTPTCAGLTVNANASTVNGVVGGGGTASPYGHAVSRTPLLDFAPRIGFAWNAYGNGKTSVRGGYGIFFEQQPLITFQNSVYGNPAYVQTPTFGNPTSFLNPGTVAAGTAPIGAISGVDPNWKQPYVEAYNLSVQQQITKNDLFEIGYVGNRTIHLQGEEDLNQPLPDTYLSNNVTGKFVNNQMALGKPCATGTAGSNCCYTQLASGICYPSNGGINTSVTVNGYTTKYVGTTDINNIAGINTETVINQIRPYVGYSAINFVSTRYKANYNGLQMSLSHRQGRSIVVGVSYTFSKALANDNGPANPNAGGTSKQYDPQNRYDLSPEYGTTTLDRRNIFVSHAVYTVPINRKLHGFLNQALNGYEVSFIAQGVSGTGLTAFQNAYDPAGQGLSAPGSNSSARPQLNADPNHGLHNQLNWFKHDVCPPGQYTCTWTQVPQQGTPGGSERVATIVGPGYVSFNMDAFKNFEIRENLRFQIRAEAFNLPNHVNFNNVQTQSGAPAFGSVTSAYANRVIRFGAKLKF